MKKRVDGLTGIALLVAGVSLVLSLISRFMMQPLPFAPGDLSARSLLGFTNTCLLIAVVLILLDIAQSQK